MKRSAAASSVDNDSTDKRACLNKGGSSCSGDQHPAASSFSILQADLLERLMNDMTAIVTTAHEPSREPRPALDKTRKLQMRSNSFGSSLNSLQRAYSKLLHEAFENEWSSNVAANVRDLADAVVWKLDANCPQDAEEGKRLMQQMLEHLQVEFKWEKILAILEAAAGVARTNKADSYQNAKACQEQLREIRRKGD